MTANICLDLGSDSLKVTYSYLEYNSFHYGKIVEDIHPVPNAVNSSAFFSDEMGKWIFGSEIDRCDAKSYIKIVKIKNLLSLLIPHSKEDVFEKNKDAYNNGHDFPKFLYPFTYQEGIDKENFADLIENDYTFREAKSTPKSVCEKYFAFVYKLVEARLKELRKKEAPELADYTLSIIYSGNEGACYVEELKRLISTAFGKEIYKSTTSTRAIAYYAQMQNLIRTGDRFLVFDVGDDTTSVTHAFLSRGANGKDNVLVDGPDGHMPPAEIGGNNVDELLIEELDDRTNRSETIGSDSYGGGSHLNEEIMYAKKYMTLRGTKIAKAILSSSVYNNPAFSSGAPVSIYKGYKMQTLLTRKLLNECSGVGGYDPRTFAYRLYEYVKKELRQKTNAKVKKVFFSGGGIHTAGVLDFIKEKLQIDFPFKLDVVSSFGEESDSHIPSFFIPKTECSLYSPSVGMGIISVYGIEMKLCLSYSYATYSHVGSDRVLSFFAQRGEEVVDGKKFPFPCNIAIHNNFNYDRGLDEELFATPIVQEDIENFPQRDMTTKGQDGRAFIIGEPFDKRYRNKVKELIDLKDVKTSDNKQLKIIFLYQGKMVTRFFTDANTVTYYYEEGIKVDKNGHATVYIERNEAENAKNAKNVYFTILGSSEQHHCRIRDLDIDFNIKNPQFDTVISL